MKKVIPFSKEIAFQTKIKEITDIEITHNLEVTDNNTIEGSFLVNGEYRMSDASPLEEEFHYDLPFTIEVDGKYDLSEVKIKINDFYFEIMNEDILKVNVELELSEVLEKDIIEEEAELLERCYDEEDNAQDSVIPSLETLSKEKVKIVEPIDILDQVIPETLEIKPKVSNKSITDMFPTINKEEDTFKSYYVYIVRENDTLDEILVKYKTTKEEVQQYNNLEELKIGSKLIIPCSKDE